MQGDTMRRLRTALPGVLRWIEELLAEHAKQARAVSTLGFTRLPACFPKTLLERAKVVTVPEVPFPPLDRLGLPELAQFQRMPLSGITFKDTFFLKQGQASESLHFHELVHVVQWERLGADDFLLAYGTGLIQFGYEKSPLEQMAHSLQQSFDSGRPPEDLVNMIEKHADAICSEVVQDFQAGEGA